MTEEKIDISEEGWPAKLAHMYIVECQSIGAFSGSPVSLRFGEKHPIKHLSHQKYTLVE